MEQAENKQPMPPEGATRAPAAYFTGVVWVKTLVPANAQTDCVVSAPTVGLLTSPSTPTSAKAEP